MRTRDSIRTQTDFLVNVYILEILAAVAFDWVNIVKSIEVVNTDDKRIIIKGKDIQWSRIPIYLS